MKELNQNHFYSRYGKAMLYTESDELSKDRAVELLEHGLGHFRLVAGFFEGQKKASYTYQSKAKGNPKKGIFLASSTISTDKGAHHLWNKAQQLLKKLRKEKTKLDSKETLSQAIAPSSGEYNNGRSRHAPTVTLGEAVFCAITTLTPYKPSISFRGKSGSYINHCIIPDLPLDGLIRFIKLFERMTLTKTQKELLQGRVVKTETKNKVTYKPYRPLIYNGNFPNPPRSAYLAVLGILASIAEWAEEADETPWAEEVLDSLKGADLYLVSYGDAKPVRYNHFIIELAKQGELRRIIDSIYYTEIFGKGKRSQGDEDNTFKKFDMFASRFLQLLSGPTFKDFIAFRAQYSYDILPLFNLYFTKMENIDPKIVSSARELGSWLNFVAYLTAKNEDASFSETFKKAKAKVLIEIESSVFSAKSGDALVAQVITRAGRLSGMDAPEEATTFIEAAASGELSLERAKNLLMVFARLRSKYEKKGSKEEAAIGEV